MPNRIHGLDLAAKCYNQLHHQFWYNSVHHQQNFDSDMSLLISASIIRKSSDPNTVLSGIPLSTGESPLIAPGSLTKFDRLVRKFKKTYTKMSSDFKCF